MDIKKAYEIMQRASGIKVGDTVRVLRSHERHEMGSDAFDHSKNEVKRKESKLATVTEVRHDEIVISWSDGCKDWLVPFFALEIVEHAVQIDVKFFSGYKDVTATLSNESKQNLIKELS